MPYVRVTDPGYLLLIPALWALTWWFARTSLAGLDRVRSRLALGIRWVIIALLVLAIAGVQWVRPVHDLCTIFVVDVSQSVAPDQQRVVLDYIHQATKTMKPGDRAALVAFGADALLDHAPEDRAKIAKLVSLPSRSRTDIAAGIQLAMASFPGEMGKQILLFSDGNENLGNAADQAALAQTSGVRISVVPLQRHTARGEALLLHADVPREVRAGEPFQVSVVAQATADVAGEITLFCDNAPVATRKVTLPPGKTVIGFPQIAPEQGAHQYRAILELPDAKDTLPDNNLVYAYTRVAGKPTVLIVEGTPGDGAHLTRTLQANDLRVEVAGPDRIPATLAECARYDSLLFANVPAWKMSPTQMSIIRSAVRDTGMGFAMVGGEESFGAGGYYRTPIEETLPVTMDLKKQKSLAPMALVIVIDISGSMGELEDGVPKIKLAAEAASRAVELMQPMDQICVIGYDSPGAFDYVVKMTRVNNKPRIITQIHKLQPGGGGIYGYSALKEAYGAIRGTRAAIKHVIFAADSADDDEPQGSVQLAQQMAQEKITLSVIGFGTLHDPFVPHFKDMAKAGQGEYYQAERLGNLPQIFTRDVLQMHKGLYIEEPFRPRVQDTAHPVAAGIPWSSAPPLLGYVATSAKESPSTRLMLTTHKDDPLLAAWSFGLGKSVAFTSDATAHWGVHWLGWEGYSAFWSQAVRWTVRQDTKTHFETHVAEDRGRAQIEVEAITPDGAFRNLLDLQATVAFVPVGRADLEPTRLTMPLEQRAPGRYGAEFDTRDPGVYLVTVTERDGKKVVAMQTATLTIPYSPEFQQIGTNTALLGTVAERGRGVVNPTPDAVYGKLRTGSRTLHSLWPGLLAMLAVLFLFDVAVRRVIVPWGDVARALRRLVPVATRPTTAAGETPEPTRVLLASKTRLRTAVRDDQPAHAATLEQFRHTVEQAEAPPVTPQPDETLPPPTPNSPTATTSRLLAKKRARRDGEP